MDLDLTKRNAATRCVITGGTQGLGYSIAERLAAEGAPALALVGRDEAKGKAAAEAVGRLGADCHFVKADLTDPEQCVALMETAREKLGGINALVNSAASSTRGTLLNTSVELWDFHMNTNVRAPFLLMQNLVRDLVERKQPGSIVNIASMVVHCGQSYVMSYSASKGALANLTKNTAHSFAKHHIRCNAILTGWMDTPGEDAMMKEFHGVGDDWLAEAEAKQPMKTLVKPARVAGLAAYMLSDDSGVMTGSLVDFDQHVAGAYPEEDGAN